MSAAQAGAVGAEKAIWDKLTFDELYPTYAFLGQAYPAEVKLLRSYHEKIAGFRENVVAPRAVEIEREIRRSHDYVPRDVLAEACRLRLFSSTLPDALGGLGLPFWGIPAIAEEISAGCLGVANLLFVNMLGIAALAATFDFKALSGVLRKVVEGERAGRPCFVATAVTEPGAGSDMEDPKLIRTARISTTARPVNGGFEVTGSKVFISNGSIADVIVLFVPEPSKDGEGRVHAFLVTPDLPGFKVGRIEKKMGSLAALAVELVFDRCVIPNRNVIRPELEFMPILALVLGLTRGGVGAFGAGVARGAFEMALDHALRTRAGGRRLIDHQWVQFELTAMARNAMIARAAFVEASLANSVWGLAGVMGMMKFPGDRLVPGPIKRFLFERLILPSPWVSRFAARRASTALAVRRSDVASVLGDHAKVSGSDLAVENARRAVLLMGADGVREGSAEKLDRDAKLLQIYEGTNQVNGIDLFERLVLRRGGEPEGGRDGGA